MRRPGLSVPSFTPMAILGDGSLVYLRGIPTVKKLSRLVYTSKAHQSFTSEMLGDLAEKSQQNNQRADITGLLLYGGGHFLQLLEGKEKRIRSLYDKHISKDPRHVECKVLFHESCEYRLFPKWGMGQLYLNQMGDESQKAWDALAREVASQNDFADLASDRAMTCIHRFVGLFGDEYDQLMHASWEQSIQAA